MELEKLYAEIMEKIEVVKERHEKFVTKSNKSAEADVRIALGEVKKLITPYRQASVAASKGGAKVETKAPAKTKKK